MRVKCQESWWKRPGCLVSPPCWQAQHFPIINSTYKASTCLYPPLSWGWRKAPLDRKSPWSVGKEPSVLAAAAPTLTLSAPAVLLSLAHRRTQAASQDTWVLARLCAYLIFSLFFFNWRIIALQHCGALCTAVHQCKSYMSPPYWTSLPTPIPPL